MKRNLLRLWAACIAMLAASCGGGGGGDAGGGAPSNADAPTYLVISPPSATVYGSQWLTMRTTLLGAYTLGLGQWAVDVAQRMTHAGTPSSLQLNCSIGTATLTLDDRDGNGRVSTGDTVTAAMQRCSSSAARVPLTGSLRIEVQAGTSAALDRVVALRVSASGLRLDGDFSDLVAPSTLTGAFNVQWDEDDTTQSLRVTTVGTEELQFLYGFGPNNVRPDRLRRVELSRRADFAAAEIRSSMSFVNEVNDGGGTIQMSTPQPVTSTLSGDMKSGEFRIQGMEGHIQIQPRGTAGGLAYIVWNSGLGARVREGTSNDSLADNLLRWHGHALIQNTPYGTNPALVWAWTEIDPQLVCTVTGGPCGGEPTRDDILSHPVLPQAGATSPQARFRVQVGLPLAATQPEMRFEIRDCNFDADPSPRPTWHIPVTVVRHGAFFVLQPQETLRHGRRYKVSVTSPEDPFAPATVQLADGSTRQLSVGDGCFLTPSKLLLALSSDAPNVVGADDSTTLRSQVTVAQGQAVASYRWQQVSGPGVSLGTPNAATTTVAYADAGPRLMGDVLLQLTVTDVQGNEQRTRIQLRVGDHLASGATAFTESTMADGRRIRNLVQAGIQEFWPVGTDRAWAPWYIDSGDGSPLAVGRYDDAQATGAPGTRPHLGAALNANDCLGTMSAWFEILEFDRNASGAPARMSVDYETTCDLPRLPDMPTRSIGSYRFNSTIPVRH